MSIKLGDKAKDTITGYTGIVVAMTTWINGCRRVTLQTQALHEGKPIDNYTADLEHVEVVQAAALPANAPSGGPTPAPSRSKDPK